MQTAMPTLEKHFNLQKQSPSMTPKIFFIFLFLLSFLSSSSSTPTDSLRAATVVLSNSGYLSMSLILQFTSDSLIPNSPSLTIFSPSDTAFKLSGQPSLSVLQLHFCPLYFPLKSLKSQALGAKIPTLSVNRSLAITSNGHDVSLNWVTIKEPPIYDYGSLVIFGIDEFFNPISVVSGNNQGRGGNLACSAKGTSGYYSFKEASWVLKSKGYSVMASFLDLQLGDFNNRTMLTIFAPVDEVMKGYVGNVKEDHSLIFLRHVVPCKILWGDLADFDDGAVLETYLDGFGITMSRSSSNLKLNEVAISYPDLYHNDWLVVHGLRGVLAERESSRGHGEAVLVPSSSGMVNFKPTLILSIILLSHETFLALW